MLILLRGKMFLSKATLRTKINELFKQGTYGINFFSDAEASYDLRLGKEVFVTTEKKPLYLEEGDIVKIEPGQFALLTTEEYLTMPNDLLGFITIRNKYKMKGLINISGFHVDPGFKGKLIFSVYNIGPTTIVLKRKEQVFAIFYAEIEKSAGYKKDPLESIPTDVIEALVGARHPSLYELESNVERNWTYIKIYGGIITTLLITLLGIILNIFKK